MHFFGRVLVAIFVGILVAGCPLLKESEVRTLIHNGLERTYVIHVPEDLESKGSVPLVLVLHGATSCAQQIHAASQFDEVADREGFIVAYPDGIQRQWNDGRGVSFGSEDLTGIDDVGFLMAVIDEVSSDYAVDAARIHVAGSSNGGMMAHRLACERPDRIASIASVSGTMPVNLRDRCTASRPISVLAVHGTADFVVPWEGGHILGVEAWGDLLSVEETLDFWVKRNGCSQEPEVTWLPDTDPEDNTRAWREYYPHGAGGTVVVLYGVQGGGHTWPCSLYSYPASGAVSRDFSATEVIWQFFQDNPLN